MSKFNTILSSQYRETDKKITDNDIYAYMKNQGMDYVPDGIVYDGKLHRFSTDPSKPFDDAGWYVADIIGKNYHYVSFGDWRKGLSDKFGRSSKSDLTPDEKLEIEYMIQQHRRKVEEEQRIFHEEKAREAASFWEKLPDATAGHGYLARKKILPHGARLAPDGRLVVPLFNDNGEIRSLQFIPSAEGMKKKFYTGCEVKGCFWWLGDPDSQKVFLCEGFATGASIYEVSGSCTFIAFSASALATTAKILREHGKSVTVIADNDDAGRIGSEKCEGCNIITIPIEKMDANDYQNATGELADILPDLSVQSKMLLADDILNEDLKVSWLIKGWIPANSIGMIHGASASGKTTIMLDMLLSASSGMSDWHGGRIRQPINVVYLCGEGLVGVKRRIRAWKYQRDTDCLGNFAVDPLPLDLDTPVGIHEIRSQIDSLGWSPDIIVIDTVNRYMSGDENSAQDTRVLLNCVDSLRNGFNCSGLYVHHTGNSEEAKKRARGSSAWRGALDYEISVSVDDETGARIIEQVKMKDTEILPPMYGNIEGAEIPGLFDDDGEQVTGAVFNICEAPESEISPKVIEAVNELFRVYTEKNQTNRFIDRGAWVEWLMENRFKDNKDPRKASQKWLTDSRDYRPMNLYLTRGILTEEGTGWVINDTPETHMILGLLGGRK